MKFIFAFIATLFLAAPAWAVDVQMGSGGNLVFDPAEVTISAGESVHFVNNMLPPHNVVVEDHPELGHEALAMLPGEDFMLNSQTLVTILTGVVLTKEQG
jgi:plastocyanin